MKILKNACGSLRRFYGNFGKIFKKFCRIFCEIFKNRNLMKILEKFCENVEKVLSRKDLKTFRHFVEILEKFCKKFREIFLKYQKNVMFKTVGKYLKNMNKNFTPWGRK